MSTPITVDLEAVSRNNPSQPFSVCGKTMGSCEGQQWCSEMWGERTKRFLFDFIPTDSRTIPEQNKTSKFCRLWTKLLKHFPKMLLKIEETLKMLLYLPRCVSFSETSEMKDICHQQRQTNKITLRNLYLVCKRRLPSGRIYPTKRTGHWMTLTECLIHSFQQIFHGDTFSRDDRCR